MNNKNIQLRITDGPSKFGLMESFFNADDANFARLKAMSVIFTVVPMTGEPQNIYINGLIMSIEHCSKKSNTYKLKLASYSDLEHMVIVTLYYSAQNRNGYAFISEAKLPLFYETLDIGSINESSVFWTDRKYRHDGDRSLDALKNMTTHFCKGAAAKAHKLFAMEAEKIRLKKKPDDQIDT